MSEKNPPALLALAERCEKHGVRLATEATSYTRGVDTQRIEIAAACFAIADALRARATR